MRECNKEQGEKMAARKNAAVLSFHRRATKLRIILVTDELWRQL